MIPPCAARGMLRKNVWRGRGRVRSVEQIDAEGNVKPRAVVPSGIN